MPGGRGDRVKEAIHRRKGGKDIQRGRENSLEADRARGRAKVRSFEMFPLCLTLPDSGLLGVEPGGKKGT